VSSRARFEPFEARRPQWALPRESWGGTRRRSLCACRSFWSR
jgi:hypothetical protein